MSYNAIKGVKEPASTIKSAPHLEMSLVCRTFATHLSVPFSRKPFVTMDNISLRLYNGAMVLAENAIRWTNFLSGKVAHNGDRKFLRFAEGQHDILKEIEDEMNGCEQKPTLWLHASSLGEYAVARPIIQQIKRESTFRIVVTFFSPTGYEVLKRRHPDVDHVFYLPFDTRENARRFLDAVNPQKAIFIISEYWVNYLQELKHRSVPTYIVSALMWENSPFFKWYGGMFRDSLNAFTHFFVLDEESQDNLRRLGYNNVSVVGDPLFDNAVTIASTPRETPIASKFAAQGDVFIAGSISDDKDLQMVSDLANKHSDVRFLLVPHEINEDFLNQIKHSLTGRALLHSECNEQTDFASVQSLIIDYLGDLPYLYRLAKWAYVGGGFTAYLHSVIEPVVYGLPVAFGPMIQRKAYLQGLIRIGVGTVAHSSEELDKWFSGLKDNEGELEHIKSTAMTYTERNSGATPQIVKQLMEG